MREAVGNLVEWWIWLRCEKWWFSSVAIESRKVYLKLCRWLRRESINLFVLTMNLSVNTSK